MTIRRCSARSQCLGQDPVVVKRMALDKAEVRKKLFDLKATHTTALWRTNAWQRPQALAPPAPAWNASGRAGRARTAVVVVVKWSGRSTSQRSSAQGRKRATALLMRRLIEEHESQLTGFSFWAWGCWKPPRSQAMKRSATTHLRIAAVPWTGCVHHRGGSGVD